MSVHVCGYNAESIGILGEFRRLAEGAFLLILAVNGVCTKYLLPEVCVPFDTFIIAVYKRSLNKIFMSGSVLFILIRSARCKPSLHKYLWPEVCFSFDTSILAADGVLTKYLSPEVCFPLDVFILAINGVLLK